MYTIDSTISSGIDNVSIECTYYQQYNYEITQESYYVKKRISLLLLQRKNKYVVPITNLSIAINYTK